MIVTGHEPIVASRLQPEQLSIDCSPQTPLGDEVLAGPSRPLQIGFSELDSALECDHSRRTVSAKADTQQASRR